jgi:hypothetical protein
MTTVCPCALVAGLLAGTLTLSVADVASVHTSPVRANAVHAALDAAMGPQLTQQALAGPYRVVLRIGSVEKMYTLAQYHKLHPKSGEIMLKGIMTLRTMGMNKMLKPHHLEVHVYSRRTGRVVANANCAITITDLHTTRKTMVPVVVMEGIGAGPQDLHYGNNVMLMTGHYRVGVTINSVHVSFTVFWHEPSARGM